SLNQCLWRGEQRVPITPKAFDVLRYLVDHSGRLGKQGEVLQALWPDTYVNPEVVKKDILGIRKGVGERQHQPVFIATCPRRGYQRVANVLEERAATALDLARSDGKSTMVGRQRAPAQLETPLDKAVCGERQVVFVPAEAGIGKPTLVDVFQQRAAR